MMSNYQDRNERLNQLSQMIINGEIIHKLDYIATININGRHYFNVFRRYNSPYNIVIEDNNSDIYLHQDYTIRKSLQTILCLSDYDASNIYTWNATSFKHNGPVPSVNKDIADMRWSDIHEKFQALSVNFGGIFYQEPFLSTTPIVSIPPVYTPPEDDEMAPPSTPKNQTIRSNLTCPPAPSRPDFNSDDNQAATILLTLNIPENDGTFNMSESDGSTLSMRFADILKRQPVCYCEMHSDNGSDNESDNEAIDETNYIVLRNGTMIPKAV